MLKKVKSAVRSATSGAGGNIWGAVRVAKDLNPDAIPDNLTLGGTAILPGNVAGSFATHFNDKIKSNVLKSKVNVGGVYNGSCKLIVQNRNFMTVTDVECCFKELKNVKCEGFDRIPVCILRDAHVKLLPPLADLFNEICKVVKSLCNGKISF